ncbi:MAG: inositol 2-dehydrogenase, partial [Microvirga sp.]|nr:inositol 2-dehydrogenase [Microvirga sp.]
FLNAVRDGKPCNPTGHDGLMAQRLADAATESAQSGKSVRL